MTLILPKSCNTNAVFMAAAYAIAAGVDDVRSSFKMEDEHHESNVFSKEVKETISSKFSMAFSHLISLHIKSNVCDHIIDSAENTVDAVDRVTKVLRDEYCAFETN